MTTYRCFMADCRAVLFEADLAPGSKVKKICPKCKVMNEVGGPDLKKTRMEEQESYQDKLSSRLVKK